MSHVAVLVDLDNTLVDSLPHFYPHNNVIRIRHGLPPYPSFDDFLAVVQGDVSRVYEELGFDAVTHEFPPAAVKCAPHIEMFDGARDMLDGFLKRGARLALVSDNVYFGYTQELLRRHGIGSYFNPVLCGNFQVPKPVLMRHALGIMRAPRAYALGDTSRDREAAHAEGIERFIRAAYLGIDPVVLDGERVAYRPSDVLAIFDAWEAS